MAADPNMRCVCGYRVFREHIRTVPETVEQWVLYDDGSYGGFGSTPFGTFFGSGSAGEWGLFSVEVSRTRKQLVCESCNRVRSDVPLGGVGVFGSYLYGDSIFILVTETSLLSCLRVRFTSSAYGTVDVSPTRHFGPPLPLSAPAPVTTAPTPPAGATTAGILRAVLPDVDHDGDFVVSLVDVCAGVEVQLTIVALESTVQVHTPYEAELNGLPGHLVETNFSILVPSVQPGSGSIVGIPFDRCTAVIEYDARWGTAPAAQGWTHQASGVGAPTDYSIIEGGVLGINTTDPSYWEREITLGSPGAAVFAYAKCRVQSSTPGTGEGLELRGELAPGGSGNYEGFRSFLQETVIAGRKLDSTGASTWAGRLAAMWSQLFLGEEIGADGVAYFGETGFLPIDASTVWGTQAGGGANPSLRARFGDVEGSTLIAQLRNFVVSTPGRFMRAFFRSYAPTASPVLRLYFVSDLDTFASAKVKVRYGSLSLGTTPYALGALSASSTVYFTTKNVMVEVTLSLPSLTAAAPFWFSVERDWQNSDDVTAATIHLVSATVRSS